jgi:hypothetical protein
LGKGTKGIIMAKQPELVLEEQLLGQLQKFKFLKE